MRKTLSHIRAAALASAVACAAVVQADAQPRLSPRIATVQSEVVLVVDSAIVRREKPHHDGVWKKRRHHERGRHHENRRDARNWDNDGGAYRPRATPKYAYDADGNLRIYDGRRWDRRDWDGRGRWHRGNDDWDTKKRPHRPRIIRMNSFDVRNPPPPPPPALKDILTAVPD